jgi:hypothetical protein
VFPDVLSSPTRKRGLAGSLRSSRRRRVRMPSKPPFPDTQDLLPQRKISLIIGIVSACERLSRNQAEELFSGSTNCRGIGNANDPRSSRPNRAVWTPICARPALSVLDNSVSLPRDAVADESSSAWPRLGRPFSLYERRRVTPAAPAQSGTGGAQARRAALGCARLVGTRTPGSLHQPGRAVSGRDGSSRPRMRLAGSV